MRLAVANQTLADASCLVIPVFLRTSLAAIIALAAAGASAGEQRPWFRYAELAGLHDKFQAMQPEQRRGLDFRLRLDLSEPVPIEQIRLWIEQGAERLPIAITGDQVLVLPQRAALQDPAARLQIEAPAGVRVGVRPEVTIELPGTGPRPWSQWMEAVQRAAAGIRHHAGFWSLFMPRAVGLELRFEKGVAATAWIADPAAPAAWKVDARGRVIVPLDAKPSSPEAPLHIAPAPRLALPYFKSVMVLRPEGD